MDASDSQDHFEKQHEHDLDTFLKAVLGPKDRAFLVGFGNHIRLVSDFSRSGAEMMQSWKGYEKDTEAFSRNWGRRNPATWVRPFTIRFSIPSKKSSRKRTAARSLIFSDGEDNSSSHDMMTTIEAAQSANVQLFAIRYTQKEHGKLTARNQYGIRVMDRIARETGGMHIDAQEVDPHTYFQRIAEELRTSYELGYYPATKPRTIRFGRSSFA